MNRPSTAIAFGQRNGFFYWLLSNGRMVSATNGREWAKALQWRGDDVPLGSDDGQPQEPGDANFALAMGW